MPFFEHVDVALLDSFELDVPVSASDARVLWLMRDRNAMSPDEYLQFLVAFTRDVLPDRSINLGAPFEV